MVACLVNDGAASKCINIAHNKCTEIRLVSPTSKECGLYLFPAAVAGAMRRMKIIPPLLALLNAALLIGCASTDYQALESREPLVGQGQAGTRKVVDGVDIWTFGAPPRKYRVLGVVNDTRGAGVLPMAGYYSGIAAKVKQYGGDAAIEVSSQRQYIGTTSFANATTTTSGGFSGTGYNYGNFTDVSGRVNTTSNTFASGTSVALFKHHGQFLVIKYL